MAVEDAYGKVLANVVEVAVKYVPTTCPATESIAYGEVVPMPTFPAPSMTKRSFVPRTVEEEILNLPPEAMSVPMVQLDIAAARPGDSARCCKGEHW